MIREVEIDRKRIDVRPNDQAGYMFTSPIFRDITKIVSNRTTTYKLPKTSNNLTVFGLSNNPEIISDFPYKTHSFEEYRDGLLFISGICTLLKSSEKDLEISVVWGATINLLGLKDLHLRDLKIINDTNYVDWGGAFAKFLESNTTSTYGFIKIDYGRGLTDFQYMRPAITIQGILDLIKKGTDVSVSYPARFTEVFKKTWIPLFDLNANEITWKNEGYAITAQSTINANIVTNFFGKCPKLQSSHDVKGIINSRGVIRWNGDEFALYSKVKYTIESESITPPSIYDIKLSLCRVRETNLNTMVSYIETIQEQTVSRSDDGRYYFDMETLSPDYSGENYFTFIFSRVDQNGIPIHDPTFGINIVDEEINLTIRTKEVQDGEDLPIIPNLPNMKVIDFFKTLMQMYGLFAYYDYRNPELTTTVQFLSIDDIYTEYIPQAYDWTNKLIPNNGVKMVVSYRYGDYAQTNHFKYDTDDSVYLNVDGSLEVNDTTLASEMDLIDLPFAPSINSSDDNGIFASIKLYDGDGGLNQVTDRVLWQDENTYNIDGKYYITARFNQNLHIKGDKGFINKYYKAYQHIIRRPTVVEFNVYLEDYELYLYREAVPVFIDGIYYMIIEMTATVVKGGKSYCACKAIKMPFVNVAEFE